MIYNIQFKHKLYAERCDMGGFTFQDFYTSMNRYLQVSK